MFEELRFSFCRPLPPFPRPLHPINCHLLLLMHTPVHIVQTKSTPDTPPTSSPYPFIVQLLRHHALRYIPLSVFAVGHSVDPVHYSDKQLHSAAAAAAELVVEKVSLGVTAVAVAVVVAAVSASSASALLAPLLH